MLNCFDEFDCYLSNNYVLFNIHLLVTLIWFNKIIQNIFNIEYTVSIYFRVDVHLDSETTLQLKL